MVYDLNRILEGFQSKMKIKLKELSDEDAVRQKILNNTFFNYKDRIMDVSSERDIIGVLKMYLKGKEYFNLDYKEEYKLTGSYILIIDSTSSNSKEFHLTAASNFPGLYVSLFQSINLNTLCFKKQSLLFFESKKIKYYFNCNLYFDFNDKSFTDFSSTDTFIKLCNFIVSDKFTENLDNFITFYKRHTLDLKSFLLSNSTEKTIFFEYYIMNLFKTEGFDVSSDIMKTFGKSTIALKKIERIKKFIDNFTHCKK